MLQWGRTSQCGNGQIDPGELADLARLQWGRTSQCGNGERLCATNSSGPRFNGAALHSAEMAGDEALTLQDLDTASMGPHFTVRKWKRPGRG